VVSEAYIIHHICGILLFWDYIFPFTFKLLWPKSKSHSSQLCTCSNKFDMPDPNDTYKVSSYSTDSTLLLHNI